MQRHGAGDVAAGLDQIDHAEVAGAADAGDLMEHRAQRLRYRGTGIEEVDIDAARPVMTGGHDLGDAPVFPRPSDAPFVHLADAVGALLAEQAREAGVAEAAAGLQRVVVVVRPVIRCFRAERDGDRHLRHHRGAAAADQAAVGEQHRAARARRLDRRIHACGTGADHQDIGLCAHRLAVHGCSVKFQTAASLASCSPRVNSR